LKTIFSCWAQVVARWSSCCRNMATKLWIWTVLPRFDCLRAARGKKLNLGLKWLKHGPYFSNLVTWLRGCCQLHRISCQKRKVRSLHLLRGAWKNELGRFWKGLVWLGAEWPAEAFGITEIIRYYQGIFPHIS
jgi:hypothetical protein